MRIVGPGRPIVVKVGQGARFQDRRRLWVHRDDAVGIARYHLRHPLDQIGRVPPCLPQFIQPPSRLSDRESARVIGIRGGRGVWREAYRKGEGLEGGRRRVAWIVTYAEPSAKPD